jgi:hypothetical protein
MLFIKAIEEGILISKTRREAKLPNTMGEPCPK